MIVYIDLGLPSGTLWCNTNEEGFYEFDEAVEKYSDSLPTYEQWEELIKECRWEWIGNRYKVTGPNGNSIVLPAAGSHNYYGNVYGIGDDGYYWSSTPKDSGYAWYLYFYSSSIYMYNDYRCCGLSIRLVK